MLQSSYLHQHFSFSRAAALFFLIIPIILTNAAELCAQQYQDSLSVQLDTVKVTALRSTISAGDAPLSLTTYTRDLETLSQSSSLSLSSIGNELPGLWVNDRQNYALGERLTIRGVGWRAKYGVRGIQVVLNGIPLTVADGQTMINIVEPAFIRRAELVRGPAASYWGNSSGGVLYLSTKPSYNEHSSLRLRTMAGSYGMRKASAEFSLSNSKHDMSIYSSYLTTNGFRDYSAAKVSRSGITGSLDLTSRSRLQYQVAFIYMPDAEHPGNLDLQDAENNPKKAAPGYVSAGAGKSITQGQAGVSYQLDTSAGILDITGYGIHRDLSNPLTYAIISVNRWTGGLRATLDKSWSNFDLQFGVEAKLQNDDRTEFGNAGNAQRGNIRVSRTEQVWNQAIFATGTYAINNINILGSLRFDHLTFDNSADTGKPSGNRSFQSLNPSIGINIQPGNQTIFANLSTSFEAPTTTELGNRPNGKGFNPNLEPEKTLGLEAGIRGSNNTRTVNYDVTAYQLWISNLLFPYQLPSSNETFFHNQGKITHTGIEGKFSWQASKEWEARLTANAGRARFNNAQTVDSTALDGKNVPGIPNLRLNARLSWTPGSFLSSVSYEYVSSYKADNLNTAQNDQYSVIDAKISYRATFQQNKVSLQPFLNVNNLFDRRYNSSVKINANGDYYAPAPGRNWQLGVSLNF